MVMPLFEFSTSVRKSDIGRGDGTSLDGGAGSAMRLAAIDQAAARVEATGWKVDRLISVHEYGPHDLAAARVTFLVHEPD